MTQKTKKFHLVTFGCQMNVHDSERMSGILKAASFTEAEGPRDADIIIFNTCSIREKAEQKFFSNLGRLRTIKNKKPGLKIAVAGCIAQQQADKILERAPFVDYIIGPQNIHFLKSALTSEMPLIATEDNPAITETELPVSRKDRVRAWVNIMYGCNNFCSYCIVPYTRGRERSRASDAIVGEIRELAASGFKEVTLLGQNVNSYAGDTDFSGLISRINDIEGIQRIRFVTSHPKDLSDALIGAMRDLEKVCEHIHLPLQSGSSKVLAAMNRKYTYESYLEKIAKLRAAMPDIAITSDIIAGFPQETDEDHRCTVNALKEIEFDGLFAFNYSPRPGTKASRMEGQLSDEVKSERLYEILEIQNTITERKNKKLEGTVQEILIEGRDEKNKKALAGRTRTNKIVTLQKSDGLHPGDIVRVTITKASRHSLQGMPL
ncbi:MAG: tRNA (N6-isopentenyl adenosine(37)-C2)-methylthiotransferase MiaB [Nitrospirota bacterium]